MNSNKLIRKDAVAALVTISSLVLGFGVAGCGENSDSEPSAAERKVFITQADIVCKKANQRQSAGIRAFAQAPEPRSEKAIQEKLAMTVALPPLQAEAEELEALDPPDGDDDKVDAVVTAIKLAVENGKKEAADVLKPGSKTFAEAERLAREYGFEVCGKF